MTTMIIIIAILVFLLILSYFDYKIYDAKKVPKGTPTIVDDVKNSIKKISKGEHKK